MSATSIKNIDVKEFVDRLRRNILLPLRLATPLFISPVCCICKICYQIGHKAYQIQGAETQGHGCIFSYTAQYCPEDIGTEVYIYLFALCKVSAENDSSKKYRG